MVIYSSGFYVVVNKNNEKQNCQPNDEQRMEDKKIKNVIFPPTKNSFYMISFDEFPSKEHLALFLILIITFFFSFRKVVLHEKRNQYIKENSKRTLASVFWLLKVYERSDVCTIIQFDDAVHFIGLICE